MTLIHAAPTMAAAAFFGEPPRLIKGIELSTVPKDLWSLKAKDSTWKPGEFRTTHRQLTLVGSGSAPPIFLEGPCTDAQGNLFVVDIPGGRILKYTLKRGQWSVLAEWGGEPNGLALRADGQLVVADYKEGMVCHLSVCSMVSVLIACSYCVTLRQARSAP